jgi:cytochrome b subunit of formate dehydrogenase
MGIYGDKIFPTPSNFLNLHLIFGFLIIIVGLIHFALHSGDKKNELLMKRPIKDLKSFFHSFFYLIGFAKREEQGGGGKYTSRQRVVYLALVYNFGLSAISGISMLIISSDSSLITIFRLTHILAAIFIILILIFHSLINLRHHDSTALRCSYVTGTLPLWYIRKHKKVWYHEILMKERKLIDRRKIVDVQKSDEPLANAVIKYFDLEGINLTSNEAEKFAKKMKQSHNPKEIKKFIEISKLV